jgi:gluconolactonase
MAPTSKNREETAMPVEPVSPDCSRYVALDAEVQWIADGVGADGSAKGIPWWPSEGPVWIHEGGYLLFSDIGKSQRMKWSPKDGLSVYATNTNSANGLTRDLEGRLIACEHATQRVVRIGKDGKTDVVADRYEGKHFNRPNDVVVKSDGSIWFTDPLIPAFYPVEMDYAGVYRVSADLKDIRLVTTAVHGPNGLCFSPSEQVLYINDSRLQHIHAFDVHDDGTISGGRIICHLKDERLGKPDGMKCDMDGNIYCTGPGGVWIMDPQGHHVGTIALGEGRHATNIGWGGGDWRTLFITCYHEVGCIRMKIPGVPVPVPSRG